MHWIGLSESGYVKMGPEWREGIKDALWKGMPQNKHLRGDKAREFGFNGVSFDICCKFYYKFVLIAKLFWPSVFSLWTTLHTGGEGNLTSIPLQFGIHLSWHAKTKKQL